jgi:hypothetical protein
MTMASGEHALAVVVASHRSPALVAACLDSLERAREAAGAPVHVHIARYDASEDVTHLIRDRSWASLVPTSFADIPRLRGAGMTSAAGGWIAVTEDHCVVDPDWMAHLLQLADGSCQVVGGGVGNARPGALNWAAYFSEYGFFSSARPASEGFTLVTGANVMYGPEVSRRVASWASEGAWEDVIHARLAAEGVSIRFAPLARVRQNHEYRFWAFCRDRYEHALDFARVRLRENPGTSRLVRLVTTPLLPFVLTARVARASSGEDRRAFMAALPFTFAFLSAWSWGEAVGYWRGKAS